MAYCGIALLEGHCWCADMDAERVERNHKHNQACRRASRTYVLTQHCIVMGTGPIVCFFGQAFTTLLQSAKTIRSTVILRIYPAPTAPSSKPAESDTSPPSGRHHVSTVLLPRTHYLAWIPLLPSSPLQSSSASKLSISKPSTTPQLVASIAATPCK
jgi:hypothetical protein